MTPLGREIATIIRETGPIGIDRYMALCLSHPVHGYYRTRDPLGARGDFTTAPEISQMFGELLGAWSAWMFRAAGATPPLILAELGPGRGTLMADALRTLSAVLPGVHIEPHLVETSPILRAAQERTLAGAGAAWHAGIDTLPPGPAIILANEFFDCLPVRQFVRAGEFWHERLVGLGPEGRFCFGLAPEPNRGIVAEGPEGAVLAVPGPALDLARQLGRRVVAEGGALLVIDYGHERPGYGDTLQAVARHAYADPLAEPGEADLTCHLDFAAFAQAARQAGAAIHGPATQKDFLLALGLSERAARLKGGAEIAAERLTGEMGSLFKVLAVTAPGFGPIPGLPSSDGKRD